MKGMKYILGCLFLWLVACQQHEGVEPMEEPVELTFKLDLADGGSRGLVDGDYLNLVSVYIVDANKNIVASQENISVANNATEVEVTFDKNYDLKRGIHTLMAVANHGTLTGFASDNYDALMDNQVHSTKETDNISPKHEDKVQPLSLMKEIELHAGSNQIEGELVRTFARLRIEVKNNSGSFPLKINSLTFSDNFTQQQAYVFDDGTDRKYSFDTGAPVSTSSNALIPFACDDDKAFKTIAPQTGAVLFDAYLLECKVAEGEKYTYTLDFDYDDIPYVTDRTFLNKTGIASNYEDSYFLIQSIRSGKFIRDDNVNKGKLVQGGDSEDFLRNNISQNASKDYLWILEWTGTENTYRIKNVATNRYIGKPNSGTVPMESSNNHPYRFYNYQSSYNDADSKGVQMSYNNGGNGTFLNDWSNQGAVIGGWNNNDDGNRFKFYLVEKSIKYDAPITLTTIDPITQQSSPTTAIKRNDFINVLVTVSYNPVAGKFEFKVEDWHEGGGNVEFN